VAEGEPRAYHDVQRRGGDGAVVHGDNRTRSAAEQSEQGEIW
jgi:hypothetical protein